MSLFARILGFDATSAGLQRQHIPCAVLHFCLTDIDTGLVFLKNAHKSTLSHCLHFLYTSLFSQDHCLMIMSSGAKASDRGLLHCDACAKG